jgi:hypothetical protein
LVKHRLVYECRNTNAEQHAGKQVSTGVGRPVPVLGTIRVLLTAIRTAALLDGQGHARPGHHHALPGVPLAAALDALTTD